MVAPRALPRSPTVRLLCCAAVAALAACSERCGGPEADAVDAAAAAPCVPLAVAPARPGSGQPGDSALFVITKLRFAGEGDGLDLDCVDTPAGCRTEHCRLGPDDGPAGTDNRLGSLAGRLSKVSGTDLQEEMSRAIEGGHHPLLIRLVGPTGLRDGSAESVEITFGLDADDDHGDLPSGRARVRPDPNAPTARPAVFAPVSIRDGVVTAGPARDWMPLFWTRRQIAAVPVDVAYLRFRIARPPEGSPPTGGRVEDGMLAGSLPPGRLAAAILDLDARTAKVLRPLGPIVRALVRQQADLDLIPSGPVGESCGDDAECRPGQRCSSGRCLEPSERFDGVSFSILFEAVSAVDAEGQGLEAADASPDGSAPSKRAPDAAAASDSPDQRPE